MTQSSDKPRDAPVPRRGGAPELPELQHLDAARNSANDLGLQFVEFGLIDDATILEVGETMKFVGRRGACCVTDVVLHCGRLRMYVERVELGSQRIFKKNIGFTHPNGKHYHCLKNRQLYDEPGEFKVSRD